MSAPIGIIRFNKHKPRRNILFLHFWIASSLNIRSLGIVQHGRTGTGDSSLRLDLCTLHNGNQSPHSLFSHLFSWFTAPGLWRLVIILSWPTCTVQRAVTCTQALCVLRCRSWWSQEDEVLGESIPGIPAAGPGPVSHGFSPRLLLPLKSELRPFCD